jgi:hypothetical protein
VSRNPFLAGVALLSLAFLACAPWLGCAAGGTPQGSGAGGAAGCESGTLCGGTCVDLMSDQGNCGACGTACGAGQVCSGGTCTLDCGAGTTKCGTNCVDTQNDPSNCGTCGMACPMGQVCSAGACGLTCAGGTTLCSGKCVDTQIDPANCGGCGMACSMGQICSAGACGLTCVGGTTLCSGKCVDTQTDPANCGGCNKPCPSGQTCSGGMCNLACVGGTTLCSGKCVDTQIDAANCGGCNKPCPSGQTCSGGMCSLVCVGGTTLCSGKCVDTQVDLANCGGCNKPCAAGSTCAGGMCKTTSPTASCEAILQAGMSNGDGNYMIQPDPNQPPFQVYCDMTSDGGGWTRCFQLVNTAAADLNDNTWLDNCVDWAMASWTAGGLLVRVLDTSNTVLYSATGTRSVPWTHADVTSTTPPATQYDVGQHANLVTLSNGDKMMISGDTGSGAGCWNSMGNGYVIVVYPSTPDMYMNPKLMVQPYLLQVNSTTPRDYWVGNTGWTPAMEIVYVAGGFNACGPVQAGLMGSFEFYVR